MAKILCITHGRVPMFNATAALARRLLDAGHSVVYASPDAIEARARAADVPYVQLPPSRMPGTGETPLGEGEDRIDRLRSRAERLEAAVAALGVEDLPQIAHEIGPDLLLIDIELHAHVLRCIALGIPLGLLSPFLSIVKRPGLPPLHSTVIPGRGWKGTQLYLDWLWARFRLRKRARRWRDRIRLQGLDQVSVLRHLAAKSGVSFDAEIATSEWLIPFSYRRLPVVSLIAAELDFPHEPAPGVHFLGPMVDQRRAEVDLDPTDRSRLEALHERRRSGASQALILCSLSTFMAADPDFVRRIIDAVHGESGWDLVLALAGTLDREALGALPDNVHAFSWVPQLEVLRHADCAVINAGTSVIECILFGVPMVVYSLRFNDQNGTAARVAYHGLGRVGDKDRDSAATIRSHIRNVLTEEAFRQSIEPMRQELAAYDAERRAVRIVESLIGDTRNLDSKR